jgi:hypothetical protein
MGPGVTLVADRLPLPAALAGASQPVRWAVALGAAMALSIVLLFVFGEGLYTGTYTGLMAVLAISGIVFRLLLDGGGAPEQAGDARAPQVPAPVTTLLTVVPFLILWLALPTAAFADDCSDYSGAELPSCTRFAALGALMPPIAGFFLGAAAAGAMGDKKPPPPPEKIKRPGPMITPGQYQQRPGGGRQPGQFGSQPQKAPPPKADKPNFWDDLFNF